MLLYCLIYFYCNYVYLLLKYIFEIQYILFINIIKNIFDYNIINLNIIKRFLLIYTISIYKNFLIKYC